MVRVRDTRPMFAIAPVKLHVSRLVFILNSTNHPKEEWINKRKEAKKLIYIPDSLVNSQDVSEKLLLFHN